MTKTAKLPQKKKPEETKKRPNAKMLPKAKPKIEVKAAEVAPIKQHAKVEETQVEKLEPAIAKLGSRTKKKEVEEPKVLKAAEKVEKTVSGLKEAIKNSSKPLVTPAVQEEAPVGDNFDKWNSAPEVTLKKAPAAKAKELSIDEVLGTLNERKQQAHAASTFDVSSYLVK